LTGLGYLSKSPGGYACAAAPFYKRGKVNVTRNTLHGRRLAANVNQARFFGF
jgi:hypothetical protein